MTRKQMIYAGAVAVAAAGFVVDRALRNAPSPAAAAPATAAGQAGEPDKPAARGTATPAVEDPSLAYLEKMSEGWAGRDIFAPTAAMLARHDDHPVQETKQETVPDPAEAFAAGHHLEATFTGSPGTMVMVNGKLLRQGDSIGGFRLVRIDPRRAEFRSAEHHVILSIPDLLD
jgi:hypothetical protein